MLEFRVRDTGIGIPASKQQQIFEPFRQAHGSSASGGLSGTGLGLAIAKKLVQAMGGDICLESTTRIHFYVLLPYEPATNLSVEDNSDAASGISNNNNNNSSARLCMLKVVYWWWTTTS